MADLKEVWVVCRLIPEQGPHAWELDGVYDNREAALAACVDENTGATRFEVNKDYRHITEGFEVIGAKDR